MSPTGGGGGDDDDAVWGAKDGEARVECREVGGRHRDKDTGKVFALQFGMFVAFECAESGKGGGSVAVEEVSCGAGNGRMAGLEESFTNCVTENKTFSINSMHGNGNVGGEDIKINAGVEMFDVGKDGGNGCTECNFLDKRVQVEGRKHRKGNCEDRGAGAKGDG